LADLERLGEFTDAASCARVLGEMSCADIGSAAAAGTTVVRPDRVANCESAVATNACPEAWPELLNWLDLLPACNQVFDGAQAQGEACTSSVECVEDRARCLEETACTGALEGDAYEVECSEETMGTACAGLYCLTLRPNLQDMTGICSAECLGHWDCGEGAKCFGLTEEIQACLSTCDSNADCGGGSVCTAISAQEKVCFVEVPPG